MKYIIEFNKLSIDINALKLHQFKKSHYHIYMISCLYNNVTYNVYTFDVTLVNTDLPSNTVNYL